MIASLHCLQEYLNQPYRGQLDFLYEMPGIVATLGISMAELPDFIAACIRKQDLGMRIGRNLLRLSVLLHELEEVQAFDATGFKRHQSSRHY